MIALEKNVKHLWQKRDLPVGQEAWLCLYSFRSANIHVRIVKGDASGQYFVSSYAPALQLKGYDLRKLLYMIFIELQKLTRDPYHLNTIRRMFDFLERLKNEPELLFSE